MKKPTAIELVRGSVCRLVLKRSRFVPPAGANCSDNPLVSEDIQIKPEKGELFVPMYTDYSEDMNPVKFFTAGGENHGEDKK